ncbi:MULTISPECIES: DUF2145 domain-containing protein [unclassified Roseateles]|uniref:DUF2145 domain-containing protein n=1 Tax=unclassified Roseateles TaxID=2626991 RepID=UPI0006FB2ADD|nr:MULTISPECIES: DUF2145 domain-containing protein [unclassified Roseateles]KQW45569.1 hypothetical protein ASC81_11750 [Pelomonas sp. Root405]KRA72413.1 hypothetical protein ASD88_11750 [Pelomonas sp. Root662]
MKRLLVIAALALATSAHAGRPCEEKAGTARQVEQGLTLALATARQLDASGAQVALLARAGQDLSKYDLKWSHLGFVYKDTSQQPAVWRVMHKLNHCGTDHAALYRQGLGEFFLDNPHRYEAAFVALKPELQQVLLPVLADNARVARFNERRYSMVAYAFGTTYQQSNQWVLETLAAAAAPGIVSRRAAQDWLKVQGYQPTDLRLSALTRLGGRLTQANIAFDDHPTARRIARHIDTVTVDSMFAWLPRAGLSESPQLVKQ